ncbi:MAG: MOSC domain-containing protein [Mycobacterium sp.]
MIVEPSDSSASVVGLRRYPVKSMLGEDLTELVLTTGGVDGDRALALLDLETGHVVTAKHARLWRKMLQFAAAGDGASVRVTFPDATTVRATDPDIDRRLSEVLGRQVRLSDSRSEGATIERPSPEDVLEHGDDAEVPFDLLEIGQGSSGTSFVDYAPVHLITITTIEHLGTEMLRYRPNLVLDTPSGTPYAENAWVGREITVGSARLRGILATPRCAVPTLRHGQLPRAPHAVRTLLTENRLDLPGFGPQPCVGLYAEVLIGGRIRAGDPVRLPNAGT